MRPDHRPSPSPRRATATGPLAVLAALVAAALLAACGVVPGATARDAGADGAPTTPLADVEPLADPRAWQGEVVATTSDDGIDPVATDPAQTLPATVTDAQGTTVTVTDTSRILALDLYGSLSRIVFDLGLGEQVVGRDTSSTFDEIADRPLVTTHGHGLSAESILELAPTVILTDTTLGPWDVILQMREAGIPVVVLDSHRSLETSAALTTAVADALGVPEQGAALAERTQQEIDAVTAEIARLAPADPAAKLRVAFLYVRGQAGVYYLFGQGSGADSLITSLGATDVATEIGWSGMRPVNDEGMVSAQPDLLIMMSGGLESVGGVDGLLERLPAIAQTPAGKNRRIVAMDDSQVLAFGPASAGVLDALARAFYAPETLS
ncbi:periplasmic binding protein [Xylanimonas cellulosilytica DSM 15894]|uniref:Periplasmic binding protein n=1 Tax=Xylanimonas cellulosilytica (strain DSM 15894 / JCM 12276 / CECT 5975 / KCTC 9989 / LMG 20990 / NBRC 107835 / XIL07) TaxID=446471 RepID=D1BXY2_XYLCX|nr:ABC transporter substrate-binding protein [Xylanimonas cellulosilytica]ACZ31773.1 periplasmic binding protein [Xylanimonas cellulosilytica DSM 15894]